MLTKIIASKVDRQDFEKMNQVKANKSDTENILDAINTLNKQI